MTSKISFTTSVSDLHNAITAVKQVLSSTSSLVAYSGIFFEVKNDTLKVTASDGDNTMTACVPVSLSTDGSVLVAPKPLSSLLSGILHEKTDVRFSIQETGDIFVEFGEFAPYTLRPITATFPISAAPTNSVENVNFKLLSESVVACRKSAGRDGAAIQFVSDDADLSLYSTDGFRLSCAVISGGGFGSFSGVLSLPACERVAKLKPTGIAVDTQTKSLTFLGGNITYTTRLLATPFPAVEVILDTMPDIVTGTDRSSLVNAITRLSSIGEIVTLEFKDNNLTLTASSAETGEGSEILVLTKPVVAPFRAQLKTMYMLDALNSSDHPNVEIAYSGEKKPVFFVVKDVVEITQVIMTIQTY